MTSGARRRGAGKEQSEPPEYYDPNQELINSTDWGSSNPNPHSYEPPLRPGVCGVDVCGRRCIRVSVFVCLGMGECVLLTYMHFKFVLLLFSVGFRIIHVDLYTCVDLYIHAHSLTQNVSKTC